MQLNEEIIDTLAKAFLKPDEYKRAHALLDELRPDLDVLMAEYNAMRGVGEAKEAESKPKTLEEIQREADALKAERDTIVNQVSQNTAGQTKTEVMTGRWEGFSGHPRYYALLTAAAEIHTTKNHDYAGKDVHPFDNFLQSRKLGIAPSLGTLVRASDKWNRIASLLRNGESAMVMDESVRDTLLDLANYCFICYILMEEEEAGLI